MKPLFFFMVFMLYTGTVFALPNLENYRDVEGVRLYKDHKKKNIYYITPSRPVIAKGSNDSPDTFFEIYRYLGRKGTGDSGKFWVKGLLSIGIQRDREKQQIKKIKKAVSKMDKVKYPKLWSMPVANTSGRLLFADIDLKWSQGSRWSGKKIALSLDDATSQILWRAVEAGQTQISVEMVETLVGVKKNKQGQWDKDNVSFSSTLPVTLDMQSYPSHFSKTDLGGNMVKGYTGIDVFCFDFLENLDEDLYSKEVEVAIPTLGAPLVQTVTFRRDSDYRTRVTFKLAKDLDTAYKIRITRVLMDGTSIPGPWIKRTGEAMLDVTAYKKGEENSQENEESQTDQTLENNE